METQRGEWLARWCQCWNKYNLRVTWHLRKGAVHWARQDRKEEKGEKRRESAWPFERERERGQAYIDAVDGLEAVGEARKGGEKTTLYHKQ